MPDEKQNQFLRDLVRKLWTAAFRDRRKEVLFIDTRKLGTMVDRVLRAFSDDDISKIVSTFHHWKRGTGYEDIAGFCKSATLEDIAGHGHVLTPGRYVGAEGIEDDSEPFEEKMARLTTELAGQFQEPHRLEQAIRDNRASIGFALPEVG